MARKIEQRTAADGVDQHTAQALDNKLDELADPRMKLLQTLKGVGPRTAEAVLYIDDPKRFKSGEELASYAKAWFPSSYKVVR